MSSEESTGDDTADRTADGTRDSVGRSADDTTGASAVESEATESGAREGRSADGPTAPVSAGPDQAPPPAGWASPSARSAGWAPPSSPAAAARPEHLAAASGSPGATAVRPQTAQAPDPRPGDPTAGAPTAAVPPAAPAPLPPTAAAASRPAESSPPYVPPGAAKRPGGGIGVAALVLGISALVIAVIPFLCFAAFLPALAGVVLGIVALARRSPRTAMAIVGLSLSVLSLVVSAGMSFLTVQIVRSVADEVESSGGADDFLSDALGDQLTVTVSGVGAETVDAVPVDGTGHHGIATFTAPGEGAVKVVSLDGDGGVVETLVDERAPYSGTLLYNSVADIEVTRIEITTSGAWTLDLLSSISVPDLSLSPSYDGFGDDVLYYPGGDDSALLETGPASYTWVYTSLTESDFDCEIDGDSSCEFALPSEGVFIQVLSVGDWTVSLSDGSSGGSSPGDGSLTSA